MHPSFIIQSDNGNAAQQQLFVHAGTQGISLMTLDTANNTVCDLVAYHFDPSMTTSASAEQLKEIFAEEKLLQHSYKKTDIIYAFAESILTPHEIYNSISNHEMLDEVFGDAGMHIVKTDFMYRVNLHNVYRIPSAVHTVISQQFTMANYTQQYSLLTEALKGDGLFAVFGPNTVTIQLCMNNKLLLLQSFPYSVPEDAVYHLLSSCRNFDVPVSNVPLLLYGMIDKDSALFTALYKYFLHIGFAGLPEAFTYPEAIHNYPAHYFSHLFATASCV
ncbi:MAG: DUF3822 family protein [Ferruginibacter sp.]